MKNIFWATMLGLIFITQTGCGGASAPAGDGAATVSSAPAPSAPALNPPSGGGTPPPSGGGTPPPSGGGTPPPSGGGTPPSGGGTPPPAPTPLTCVLGGGQQPYCTGANIQLSDGNNGLVQMDMYAQFGLPQGSVWLVTVMGVTNGNYQSLHPDQTDCSEPNTPNCYANSACITVKIGQPAVPNSGPMQQYVVCGDAVDTVNNVLIMQ